MKHLYRKPIIALILMTLVFQAGQAFAGEATGAQRVEFRKLIAQRDSQYAQLERLDNQAAAVIKKGGNPVELHAQQVGAQDQLDLLELQISVMSARYGLEVPPAPGQEPEPSGSPATASAESKSAKAFDRGRARAIEALQKETYTLLASIDFDLFLDRWE